MWLPEGLLWVSDYEKKGIEITPEIQWEIDQTHWYRVPDFLDVRNDDRKAYDDRIYATQDNFNQQADAVEEAYRKFRQTLKKNLFI